MSRKTRVPFPYNRLALLCLMAMSTAPVMAVTVTDGSVVSVEKGGSDPLIVTNGSTLKTAKDYLPFSATADGVSVATVESDGTLDVKNATLKSSGNSANTVSLDKGNLLASGGGVLSGGTDSWSISAQNGSRITLSNAVNVSDSAGHGAIFLDSESTLNSNTGTYINAASSGTALSINGQSTATLTDTAVASQDNDAISIASGTLSVIGGGVNTSGNNANAINAISGATIITNATDISTSGSESSAVLLGSTDSKLTSQDTHFWTDGVNAQVVNVQNGTATLVGGTVETFGADSHGLSASGGTITGKDGLAVTINGESGVGAYATNGGIVNLTDTTVKATKDNATGLFSAANGNVSAASTAVSTTGNNAAAVKADSGTVTLTGTSTLDTVGTGSAGIFSTNAGRVDATNVTVTTDGNDAAAVSADASGVVNLTDSALSTAKTGSTGISSATSGNVTAINTTITTTGANAAGVSANAGSVTLTSSPVTTSGAGSAGIFSGAAGSVTATDSDVSTTGADAWALSVNQGSISVTNGTLTTGNAAGIFATGSDAAVQAGEVTLNTVTVDAAQSSILSQGGMLNVNATGTTFNSATDRVLDVQADAAGVYSTVNLNADSSTLNGSLVSDNAQNTANVMLSNGSSLTGYSDNISSVSLDSTSSWDMTANSNVQSLTNNGTITFSEPTSGDFKTLTVNGDYSGNGGKLIMNTQLGDDSSPTDKLVVTGNVNAGDTLVAINNIGGTGSYTVNGIEVVSVGGVSEGTFTKSGRIVAGAYDYNLEKINESWYLTNKAPEVTDPGVTDPGVTDPGVTDPGVTDPGVTDPGVTDPGVTDPGVTDPGVTDPGVTDPGVTPPGITDPKPGPDTRESQYRPETGSYLANMLAANTMFDHRMQDRLGEGGYARSAEGAHADGLWMRHVGSHNRFYDDSAQLKARTNRYVLQLGVDLAQWSSDGYDRWHVGVMGGYGNAQSNIRSELTGYRADSKVEGYSAGVYATWVESEKDMSGAYVDSWVLYNWFRNTINGEGLATEHYDSKGFTASLEAGYTVPMTQGERVSSWLQPKVQLTWMDVGADNHREHNGTWVTDDTDGMLRSRVGVRAYLKGHSELDNNTGRDFQPFVEANWLHNFNDYSVKMDDVTNNIAGDKNVGELKLGVEGKIANDFTMWGNVAQQMGSAGYSDTTVMFGARVNF